MNAPQTGTMETGTKPHGTCRSLMNLFTTSLILAIYLFGSWSVLVSFFPIGLFLVALMTLALYWIRVPPPGREAVDAVLGVELFQKTDGYKLRSIAHRGAGFDAPENSLEAFRLCQKNGFEGIECDISVTSDDVSVMFHDNNLKRLANLEKEIAGSKWEDLAGVDISVNHPFRDRFPNTSIPTLDDAVKLMLDNGQRIILDLKDSNLKLVNVILEIYNKYPELYRKAAVSSFFPHLIYMIRKKNPKIVGCVALRPQFFSLESFSYAEGGGPRRHKQAYKYKAYRFLDTVYRWLLEQFLWSLMGISAILIHRDAISAEGILNWRSRGVRVICWSVNTPIEKQFYAHHLKITYLTDTATAEYSTHQVINSS